uniref:Cytochrome b n=1 Tax=Strongyloides venezuelensis TaxID=75913 RepID=A0A0N7KVG6_STRVS|nr:cytochrome b [Strongyloides venezuelensis]BAT21217.1 cytochrome b [Strongyloides venezuelensis]
MSVFVFLKNMFLNLPVSKSLSLFWNFGSMLGMILVMQVFTGFCMALYYVADSSLAFDSVQYIMYETNYGWFFRLMHMNGASLFFIFLYLHFFKGLFMSSYRLGGVWITGLLMFLMIMGISFMGYVLVWAQMSFWAAVVITSLLSVIPYFGNNLVLWVWSGFSVGSATLKFLCILHYLLPWVLFVFVVSHLVLLHKTGSTSSLYCHGDYDKVCFYPYYYSKDGFNIIFFMLFISYVLVYPYVFSDPEMFIQADPMTSPAHIVPEWYFLFAYAILRAIPNKVLGVVFLLSSIFVFFLFVFLKNYTSILSNLNKFVIFSFLFICIILSWLGQCQVEYPFNILSVIFSYLYFIVILFILFYNWVSYYIFK